jgi:cytoskeleton protein RodZ
VSEPRQSRNVASYRLAGDGSTVLQERRARLADSRTAVSSAVEGDEAPPFAPRAGGDLRAARERVGWSLGDIAAALHIKPHYLEALEAGRIGDLPGNAYALGFLRTYARALGLEPNEIVRRFKVEADQVSRKTELAFPVPVPERGVPAGAVVLLGALLTIGAYAGWYRLSGEGRLPAETSTQVPLRLAPLAQQAVPQAVVTMAAAPPAEPTPTEAPTMQPPALPPLPAVSPTSAAAAPVSPPPAAAAAPDQPRILLRASADAWVQVRDKAGPVLLNRTLHPGETWEVPPRPNLLLTTGNAGGTDLVVDGVSSPPLGGSGAVRRDLPLDPDLIRDGKLVAAAARPVPQ